MRAISVCMFEWIQPYKLPTIPFSTLDSGNQICFTKLFCQVTFMHIIVHMVWCGVCVCVCNGILLAQITVGLIASAFGMLCMSLAFVVSLNTSIPACLIRSCWQIPWFLWVNVRLETIYQSQCLHPDHPRRPRILIYPLASRCTRMLVV